MRSPLHSDFLAHLCQTSPHPIGLDVVRAEGSWFYTRDGNRYLDFISGICVANVGHRHPKVVRAVVEQIERFAHVMVYGEFILEPQVRLAARLAVLLPDPLSVVYLTNSGAEANEGALKAAKKYTRRSRLIAFEGGFHGDTHGSLSVTGREVYRKPFEPLLPDVEFLPFGDAAALTRIDERVAAVIIEPIQGEGGVRLPPEGFLAALRKRCSEVGALLIFDEIQTGIGRTGKNFAMEHWGVVPDVVTLAKALGGGMPIGAFVGSPRIMKTLSEDPPLSHVTTFGGNPVCCAAALATLEILTSERLADRAEQLGAQWRKGLQGIKGVREVRGMGLMIGMEMESAEVTAQFVSAMLSRGLILGWTLHSDRVVRIAPPLTISEEEIKWAGRQIREGLEG